MLVTSIKQLFGEFIPRRLKEAPGLLGSFSGSYRVVLSGSTAETWLVDLSPRGGTIARSEHPGDFELTVDADTLLEIVNGNLEPDVAFMRGKLHACGDVLPFVKLRTLLFGDG